MNNERKLSRTPYPIRLYDRRSKYVEFEKVYGRRFMDLCYETRWGRRIEAALLCRPGISRMYGMVQNHPLSRRLIPKFVAQYGIDLNEAVIPPGGFGSFNSFFSRRLKQNSRIVDTRSDRLISPADSRLQVFSISPDLSLTIKGLSMTLPRLLGQASLDPAYQGGVCLCFRLAPCDYHRFGHIEDGIQAGVHTVHGPLHSVNPMALRHKPDILATNYRQWCLTQSPALGTHIQVEVGAMMVGSIVQRQPQGGPCRRGREKGYFQFGGSTVLVLLQPGRVIIDDDIARYSAEGIETLVRYGESVARILF